MLPHRFMGVAAYVSACITITMGLTYYNADVSSSLVDTSLVLCLLGDVSDIFACMTWQRFRATTTTIVGLCRRQP